jgi:hypothetical protein
MVIRIVEEAEKLSRMHPVETLIKIVVPEVRI